MVRALAELAFAEHQQRTFVVVGNPLIRLLHWQSTLHLDRHRRGTGLGHAAVVLGLPYWIGPIDLEQLLGRLAAPEVQGDAATGSRAASSRRTGSRPTRTCARAGRTAATRTTTTISWRPTGRRRSASSLRRGGPRENQTHHRADDGQHEFLKHRNLRRGRHAGDKRGRNVTNGQRGADPCAASNHTNRLGNSPPCRRKTGTSPCYGRFPATTPTPRVPALGAEGPDGPDNGS